VELKFGVSKKNEIERLLSIIQLGLLHALEVGVVTIEEVEGYLFNPYSVKKLEQLELNERVIDIIRHGCELEDVNSLFPEKLLGTIIALKQETINNLKLLPKPSLPTEKIIKN
jgi:hypothetical protein